ncbi:MAG: DNA topoisomerase VI subunit B [Proteobacteria bacterium]|nr:DNA topoisomerase VI subunit B [Pseudomonadota bacterium]
MTLEHSHPDVAHEMAAHQRDISVSEFFLKNRHLLGFDSPSKASLTTVKEAVDNALDACEEAGLLPEIRVEVSNAGDGVLSVSVEDNGPGIVEEQLGRIFGKLLYGSKFHKLSQSRGQQGMGIAAAGMYAQLTTGKPLHVLSRVQGESTATELFVSINTAKNRPDIQGKKRVAWDHSHGTRVEAQIEGHYPRGRHSISTYLKQTAIANLHVTIHFRGPHGEQWDHECSCTDLPPRPVNVKPHPRGVELGQLIQMLNNTESRTLLRFLEKDFSRVGRKTARRIIRQADQNLTERSYPKRIAHRQSQALYRAIQTVPISGPRTDCIAPIGEQRLAEGLHIEFDASFYTVTTRPPAVYRGNPYQIEVGLAYGQAAGTHLELDEHGHIHKATRQRLNTTPELEHRADEPAYLLRFANRVPLLFDQEGCAITKAVMQTNWRSYGLEQAKGALPHAPLVILAHMASVWVPYTSEAKEAIAPYPEIVKEIRLGLQSCGRRLAAHLHHETRVSDEFDRRTHLEKYLPHIGVALQTILALSDDERERMIASLDNILHEKRRL